jgi:SAM-dependent methyltransferase
MSERQIPFNDGAACERMMGAWSRMLGTRFLDWLDQPPGLNWIDVGCGDGAFTALLAEQRAPASLHGVDPSEAQIAFARTRPGLEGASWRAGDAMELPFEAGRFDAATMALVICFVPEPAKGVAEMARVTRPGGTVAACAWDIPGGGRVFEPLFQEMRAMGREPPGPPNGWASGMEALRRLWTDTGLVEIDTLKIPVSQTFPSFEAFWASTPIGTGLSPAAAALPLQEIADLKARVAARMGADAAGRVTCQGWANAVKGKVEG